MNVLKIFIDQNYFDEKNDKEATDRWNGVYAHGDFEEEYQYYVVRFNQPKPSRPGYFIATAENGRAVVINMQRRDGRLQGRCCYVDDYNALIYVNRPKEWS